MKIFGKLKEEWKAKTRVEKLKTILEGVCNLGADLMMGYVNMRLIPPNEKKWKKAVCVIFSGGVGMGLGKMASNQLNDIIDSFSDSDKEEDDDA